MQTRASGRSPEVRRRILLAGVLLSALACTVRAFKLEVMDGAMWRAKALEQQGAALTLPAPRGTIYDRDGLPLAASQEVYSVAIAPREVADRVRVAALLQEHLGLTQREAARALDVGQKWVVLPGRYSSVVRSALDRVAGVHFQSVMQRFYPNGAIGRELLGAVRMDGVALGGLELEFDTVLNGRAGRAVVRRDSRGRALPGAMLRAVAPIAGRDVVLTIDYDLQEIADQALTEAIEHNNAAAGELLLTDPRTGEILAAVSRGRDARARNWRAVTDPYEPGSVLKPFTVAALLSLGRASFGDSVYGEKGHYERLQLTDSHAMEWMTLADALRESSNIGVAKMAERLTRAEQYLALREFGFGTPTGVSYPSESGGRLWRPAQWSFTSASRIAIGYEVSVTPLQLAMGYGALANGGNLLEPRLVREVRSREGVDRSYSPRVVRRVITKEVADAMRRVLVDAVEAGTGSQAALGAFEVAGKTGTVRIAQNGRYRAGAYTASFAGFFPAEDPQLVFVVKLDEPRGGSYYGGAVAAPVTRATLEAALATRNTPLDRSVMATRTAPMTPVVEQRLRVQAAGADRRQIVLDGRAPVAGSEPGTVLVPDVSGMPMRDGVRRLHDAGFQLRLEGTGRVARTIPAGGAINARGAVIRVIGELAP